MRKSRNWSLSRGGFMPAAGTLLAAATGAALLIGAAPSARAAVNVLANPSFEAGNDSGWTSYGSHAVESTADHYYNGGAAGGSNVLTHSGQYVGKTWGGFTGGYNVNGYYQDAVAGAGSQWSASGYFLSHQQDFIQAPNRFWLELTFRDGGNNVLAMSRSHILDPNTTVDPAGVVSNIWNHLVVTNIYDPNDTTWGTISGSATSFTAPAGTAKVRLQMVYEQPSGYPGGSMYMDDLDLTKIAGSDPDISTGPASQQRVEGQSVTLTVVASGGSALSYKWQKDGGADLTDGGNIYGSSTASLTVSNLTAADSGSYVVTVHDNNGDAMSSPAVLKVVTAAEASNVLLNRDFETSTYSSWTPFNGGAVVASIPESAHGGFFAGELWGTGAGSWNGIFQDIVTSPGMAFTAEGWFLESSGALITGSSEAWLEIQFMNGSGNMVGLYQSPHVTSNSVAGTWMYFQATNELAFWGDYSIVATPKYLVAPAGTAKVRCQVNYHAGDGGGAVYFDDLNLFLKIPVTVAPAVNGQALTLSFPTQIGVGYQVLYKNDLSDASWTVQTTLTGDLSGQATVPGTATGTKRFYRVNTL